MTNAEKVTHYKSLILNYSLGLYKDKTQEEWERLGYAMLAMGGVTVRTADKLAEKTDAY